MDTNEYKCLMSESDQLRMFLTEDMRRATISLISSTSMSKEVFRGVISGWNKMG